MIATTLVLRGFGDPEMTNRVIVDRRYHRFAGLMGNANAAGIGFGMISVVMHGVARDLWREWRARRSAQLPVGAILAVCGAIVALALVALSQSRTALTATVIAQLAFGIAALSSRKKRQAAGPPWIFAAVLLGLGVALWAAAGAALNRYGALGDDGASRLAILRYYAGLAYRAPWTGYGLGSFDTVNQRSLTPDTVLLVGDFGAAHNAILQLAIEAGWPAVGLLAAAIVAILLRVAQGTLADGGRANAIHRAMIFAIAVAAAGSMVDIALNVPAVAAFSAVLLGIVWGRSLRGGTESRQPQNAQPAPWATAAIRN